MEYFEELLTKPSIFRDESKLDINFIPKKLPHRGKELSLLSQLFLVLITKPNSVSRKILITGKTGIGKTVTVKSFGDILERISKKRDIKIKFLHVNCRKERTSYKVLNKIIRLLDKNFPKRGYSSQDLLDILIDLLEHKDLHLLIALDELSYLINKNEDLIYSLTRINEDAINGEQRISLIGIVRDITCLNNLDNSTMSTLQRNIIKFNIYSKEQIFDILKYRTEISLDKNVLSNKLIEMISEITSNSCDIRHGLNLMWRASKIAESKNLKYITTECVRLANQDLLPFSTLDILKYMNIQQLTFFLAIVRELSNSDDIEISFSEILKSYYIICENFRLTPRSHSQLWIYLQELKRDNLVFIKNISEGIKGRRALIWISDLSLLKLEKNIEHLLNAKGLLN